MNHGIVSAVAAFSIWGVMPLYWKLMSEIPASEIMSHRIIWSLVFTLSLLLASRRISQFTILLKDTKRLVISACCAILIATNWLVYIWSVNNGFIIESSLGYFINPIISVLLGVFFLNERLRIGQWASIIIATGGVVFLTLSYDGLPWIALTLATSFGFYGLLRKRSPTPPLEGLALEAAILFVPATGYLCWLSWQQQGHFNALTGSHNFLLIGCGIITAVPLLLFAYAAQRIPLSTLGIIQYLGPTIQLLIGIWIYQEPFTGDRATAFMIIWLALLIYTLEGSAKKYLKNKTSA